MVLHENLYYYTCEQDGLTGYRQLEQRVGQHLGGRRVNMDLTMKTMEPSSIASAAGTSRALCSRFISDNEPAVLIHGPEQRSVRGVRLVSGCAARDPGTPQSFA